MIRVAWLVGAVAFAFAAGTLLAAIPPLSKEQLQSDSTLIIVGRIAKVTTSSKILGSGDEDTIFHVEIEVADVEKGDAKLGENLKAETWKPAKRQQGWAGPQGQNVTPAAGQLVRCYLRGSDAEGYTFLTPNGLDLLKDAPPAATPSK